MVLGTSSAAVARDDNGRAATHGCARAGVHGLERTLRLCPLIRPRHVECQDAVEVRA
jgi:hypothetical protein